MNGLGLVSQEALKCPRLAAAWCAQEGTWLLWQAPRPHRPRRTRKADGRCSLRRPEPPLPTRPFTRPSERSFEVVTIVPILQMRTEI